MATTTWGETGAQSWRTTYGWRTDNDRVYQGQWGGYGLHKGLWYFNSSNLRSTLSGQNIKSIRIQITRYSGSHGSSAAGVPTMRLHNYDSSPSGEPSFIAAYSSHNVGFGLGNTKWVPLPIAWGENIRDGKARGIGVYTGSDDPYLQFIRDCVLEITYEPQLQPPATPNTPTWNSSTKTSISYSTNSVANADKYRWYRKHDGYTVTTTSPSLSWGGLGNGVSQDVRVRAENSAGASSYSAYRWAETIPSTPSNLHKDGQTTTSINVDWDTETGADGYRLKRGTTVVYTGATSAYTDTGLAAGTGYTYSVESYNQAGNSGYSSTQTFYTLVAAPTGLGSTNIKHTEATLSWNAVTGASSYRVERKLSSSTTWSSVRTQSTTSWTDTGLSAGNSYDYRVFAIGNAGEGAASVIHTLSTVALPATPTNFVASNIQTHQATLSWDAVVDAVSYELQRLSTGGAVEQTWTPTTTSVTDTAIYPGGSYDYRVRSKSTHGGTSAWTANLRVNTLTEPQLAPTLVDRTDFNGAAQALFDWIFNTTNINDAQAAYELEVRRVVDTVVVHSATGTTATEYTMPANTLAQDTQYECRVRTRSQLEASFGPWSAYDSFFTVTPPVITDPLVSPDNTITQQDDIYVEWAYTQAGGFVQNQYRVEALDSATDAIVFDSGWVNSVNTSHTVSSLTSGTYDVRVTNRVKGVQSNTVTELDVNLATNTSILTANTADVYWTATGGANGEEAFVLDLDNANAKTVYHVYPKSGGDWIRVYKETEEVTSRAGTPGLRDIWESRYATSLERGATVLLSIVTDYVGTTGIPRTKFGITLEHSDATESTSYMMNLADPEIISTDIDGSFRRYTTSIVALKPVIAIRLTSRIYNDNVDITEFRISELQVSESGRIYSQEYTDTDGQRGLLISGSGYIQGSEFIAKDAIRMGGDGTAPKPSFSWENSPSTGLYRPAADEIGIAVAGGQKGRWTVDGLNVNGIIHVSSFPAVSFWNATTRPDLDTLTAGTTEGIGISGRPLGHLTFELSTPNDSDDSFYWVAPGNTYGPEVLGRLTPNGRFHVSEIQSSQGSLRFRQVDGTLRFDIIDAGGWALKNAAGADVFRWHETNAVVMADKEIQMNAGSFIYMSGRRGAQGGAGHISHANGWVNYGSGYAPMNIWIDASGWVYVRGLVKAGTAAKIANVDAQYGSRLDHIFACQTSGGVLRVDYKAATNDITLTGVSTIPQWVALDLSWPGPAIDQEIK